MQRRAEQLRQRKKRREKNRARFVQKIFFKFPKEFHCEERSGTLHGGKEEVGGYLQETHFDPLRDKSLGLCLKEVKVV